MRISKMLILCKQLVHDYDLPIGDNIDASIYSGAFNYSTTLRLLP